VTNDVTNDPLVSPELRLALGLRNILCVPDWNAQSLVCPARDERSSRSLSI
jgi:hypothetical protein